MKGHLQVVDEQFLLRRALTGQSGANSEMTEVVETLAQAAAAGAVSSLALVAVVDGKVVSGWVLREGERGDVLSGINSMTWEMHNGKDRGQAGTGREAVAGIHCIGSEREDRPA